jgi:hypothetical protein
MNEFVVAGLLISPFVKYALIVALIFIPIRFVLVVTRLKKWFLASVACGSSHLHLRCRSPEHPHLKGIRCSTAPVG